jgi:hypothetical protein
MSTGVIRLSTGGTTVPARAMLSACDTEIARQKVSPEFEQCHWSYRPLCCFYMTKWQTSDTDRPAVWWRYWSEILRRIPTVKTARTLRLCCVFGYSMEYSVPCDVLMVQVMDKLHNTLIQCHVQNDCHLSPPYLITPCRSVLVEKLTDLQLVKKISAFYETWMFITASTSACHLPLFWTR